MTEPSSVEWRDRLVPMVDALVWHLSQWELHSLRNLTTALILEAQVYARAHPEAVGMAESMVAMKDRQAADQLAEMHAELLRQILSR